MFCYYFFQKQKVYPHFFFLSFISIFYAWSSSFLITFHSYAFPTPQLPPLSRVDFSQNSLNSFGNVLDENLPQKKIFLDIMIDNVPSSQEENYRSQVQNLVQNANKYLSNQLASNAYILQIIPTVHVTRESFRIQMLDNDIILDLKSQFLTNRSPGNDGFMLLSHTPWPNHQHAGLANSNTICNQNEAVGIVSDFQFNSALITNTFIHEVLHMLGIVHDEDAGCTQGYLMAGKVANTREVNLSECTKTKLKSILPTLLPCRPDGKEVNYSQENTSPEGLINSDLTHSGMNSDLLNKENEDNLLSSLTSKAFDDSSIPTLPMENPVQATPASHGSVLSSIKPLLPEGRLSDVVVSTILNAIAAPSKRIGT